MSAYLDGWRAGVEAAAGVCDLAKDEHFDMVLFGEPESARMRESAGNAFDRAAICIRNLTPPDAPAPDTSAITDARVEAALDVWFEDGWRNWHRVMVQGWREKMRLVLQAAQLNPDREAWHVARYDNAQEANRAIMADNARLREMLKRVSRLREMLKRVCGSLIVHLDINCRQDWKDYPKHSLLGDAYELFCGAALATQPAHPSREDRLRIVQHVSISTDHAQAILRKLRCIEPVYTGDKELRDTLIPALFAALADAPPVANVNDGYSQDGSP